MGKSVDESVGELQSEIQGLPRRRTEVHGCDTPDLRFDGKSGNVEELAICSCVEVNPLITVVEHILEKQREDRECF